MTSTPAQPGHATFNIRVYYEDTDAGGVVFYANYLKFMERARTEWLRELGVNQSSYAAETGAIFIVRQAGVKYRRPARLDDLITVRSRITRLGGASVDFSQEVCLGTELLASGTVQVCCVDAANLRPLPIPEPLRSQLLTLVSD